MKNTKDYGQTLNEQTLFALAIQKLRELEELMRGMAQLKGDRRWLILAELYGDQARERLPKLATQRLAS